jgi:hypothetical protein
VGLRDTNNLLHAAGLPASYPTAGVDSPDLAPYRVAVDRMLAAHEPYPGMVLDGHFTVLAANPPCRVLFGRDLVGVNFVRVGQRVVRTVAMVARFDHPAETTLDELRVELLFPMDEEAEHFFRSSARWAEAVPPATAAPDRTGVGWAPSHNL